MTAPDIPEDIRAAAAKAICKAIGDDWKREGSAGLIDAYGPVADAAIKAIEPFIASERTRATEAGAREGLDTAAAAIEDYNEALAVIDALASSLGRTLEIASRNEGGDYIATAKSALHRAASIRTEGTKP